MFLLVHVSARRIPGIDGVTRNGRLCVRVQTFGLLQRNRTLKLSYSETSLIRHSIGPESDVGLGGCWIIECLLPYLSIVTVPHIVVGLERMFYYRGVGLESFHCIKLHTHAPSAAYNRVPSKVVSRLRPPQFK